MRRARDAERGPAGVPSRLPALALAALLLAALPACEKIDRNMWDNPAFEPQEEPVRLPPGTSVPTKGRERVPGPAEARRRANPVKSTEEAILAGKALFGTFCVPCHGASGAGDGPVGKKYVPDPADLRKGSAAAGLSDGELFVVVTEGRGGMPGFSADLDPRERWTVVAYLRTLK